MATCDPDGFPAFNPSDLVSHGVIFPSLIRTHPAGTSVAERPGQTILTLDDGTIQETRKLLPARSVQVEMLFRKPFSGSNLSLTQFGRQSGRDIGGLGILGGGTGALGLTFAATTLIGGVTRSVSSFVFHLVDGETLINFPIQLTAGMLADAEIELTGFVMTVFGLFDDKADFTEEQLSRLGLKTPFISGFQGPSDQFVGVVTLPPGNRFVRLVRDTRKDRYRADSDVAAPHAFFTNPAAFNDLTDNKISFDTSGLKEGDTLYLTAALVSERHLRQAVDHRATLFEGANRVGVTLETVALGEVHSGAWNFSIQKWRVPCDPSSSGTVSISDTFDTNAPENNNDACSTETWDFIEGWRIAESVAKEVPEFFAADSRGIVKVTPSGSQILFPRGSINDQPWFDAFLNDSGYGNRTIANSSNEIDFAGALFDVSEHVNSLLFDQQKIPYQRDFALALQSVSKFDPDITGTGIGIISLDLVNNGVTVEVDKADLSTSAFQPSGQKSIFPSGYSTTQCGGFNAAEVVDPRSQVGSNIINILGYGEPPDLFSDWIFRTPFIDGTYGRKTRVYFERHTEDVAIISKETDRVFVSTIPSIDSSISVDTNLKHRKAFASFDDPGFASLAFHHLDEGSTNKKLDELEIDTTKNHNRGQFDHNEFRYVGYGPLLAGDPSTYSNGIAISREWLEICEERISPADLFKDVNLSFSVETEGNITVNLDRDKAYRQIVVEYNSGFGFANLTDVGHLISFEFEGSGQVISNIAIPLRRGTVPAPVVSGNIAEVAASAVSAATQVVGVLAKNVTGEFAISVDARYYSGTRLRIRGDALSHVQVLRISATESPKTAIEPLLVAGRQTSTIIDDLMQIFVFYTDDNSNNISCAMSPDLGHSWIRHTDIIRLKKGERADTPYIIKNKDRTRFHLLYRLNDTFLMMKKLNPHWFVCQDSDVEYESPTELNDTTDDLLGLEKYEPGGQQIRLEPSYFVCGDKNDTFFEKESEITAKRIKNDLAPRFVMSGDPDTLTDSFVDASYAAFTDGIGNFRLFYVLNDGKFYMKVSPDGLEWIPQVSGVTLHRNFTDEVDEDTSTEIKNIQVIFDEKGDKVYTLYFNQGSLFLRVFDGLKLYSRNGSPDASSNIGPIAQNVVDHLSIDAQSANKPIFLVGQMESKLAERIKQERTGNLTTPDPNNPLEVLVSYQYPIDIIDTFDANFAVEEAVKPAGWFTAKGFARVLYKSTDDVLFGLTINGDAPKLDAHLRI